MAIDNLKVDIINDAFSQLRISGLTVQASPEDNTLALRKLESMANELFSRNVCVGYNFEDQPDLNSTSGLPPSLWFAFSSMLALRLVSDFGKGMNPDPVLVKDANAGLSFLHSVSANPQTIQYPSRQPVGSGNSLRYSRFRKFYIPVEEASETCKTNHMFVDDVNTFTEHFDSYLLDGETIASYTIEADTGLTLSNDSNTTTDVSYTITATGNNGTKSDVLLRVKIVVTTSDSRKTTRIINFELETPPEIK